MNVREALMMRRHQPKKTQMKIHIHPAVAALRAIRAVWKDTGIDPVVYQKKLRKETDIHAEKQYGRS